MRRSAILNAFRSSSDEIRERMRRLIAAAESQAIGYGGASIVARATGVSRRAIAEGTKELGDPTRLGEGRGLKQMRTRRPGSGRKRT